MYYLIIGLFSLEYGENFPVFSAFYTEHSEFESKLHHSPSVKMDHRNAYPCLSNKEKHEKNRLCESWYDQVESRI